MKPEPHGAISSTLSFLHNTDAMDWTFEGRRAVIHLNDKMMASLKPRGLIGYRRQEGSYEGKGLEIIARSGAVAWKEVMTSEHGVEPIRWILLTGTYQQRAELVCPDKRSCFLMYESIEKRRPAWWFVAEDGRKLTVTEADFMMPRYSFRVIDLREDDPNPWLLAVVSLYNILRFNYPS